MKVLLHLFRLGCLLFLLVAAACLWLLWGAVVPAQTEGEADPVLVEIAPGATAREIAADLKSRGVIANDLAFRLLVRCSGKGREIRAGHYRISPSESPLKILERMVQGESLVRTVTIPEGLTLVEVAEILEEHDVVGADEFLRVARKRGKEFGAPFPENLEGYLFPDTYTFPWEVTAEEVVQRMVDRFRQVALPLWGEGAPLPLHQTVILASLVERETRIPQERPLVAGVYLNRLERDMPLQCDATVQYALGKPKEVLTFADLEVESPYNTYLHPGLPPGPIANPGEAAIRAAVQPQASDYLYYVLNDVKGDGSHVFSRTYAEHRDAIRRYQR